MALDNRDTSLNPVFSLALIAHSNAGKTKFYTGLATYFSGKRLHADSIVASQMMPDTKKGGFVRNYDLVRQRSSSIHLNPLGVDVIEHPKHLSNKNDNFALNCVFDTAVSIEHNWLVGKTRTIQFFIPESVWATKACQQFLKDASRFRLPTLPVERGGVEDHLLEYVDCYVWPE